MSHFLRSIFSIQTCLYALETSSFNVEFPLNPLLLQFPATWSASLKNDLLRRVAYIISKRNLCGKSKSKELTMKSPLNEKCSIFKLYKTGTLKIFSFNNIIPFDNLKLTSFRFTKEIMKAQYKTSDNLLKVINLKHRLPFSVLSRMRNYFCLRRGSMK